MKKIMIVLFHAFLACTLVGCGSAAESAERIETESVLPEQSVNDLTGQTERVTEHTTEYSEEREMSTQENEENPALALSEQYIRIYADENEAVFRLYDTAAAQKLYEQLPLTLDTENFRDAQWMFYPPEKLPVTAAEAYHDGIKGELSYYEPWGDVFILYEDFYAGDEMHRLGVCTSGIDILEGFDESITVEKLEQPTETEVPTLNPVSEPIDVSEINSINIQVGDTVLTATLARNSSADALKEMLAEGPVTIEMSDYGNMEKVGSLGKTLPDNDEPITTQAGDLILYQSSAFVIYYAPNSWEFTRLGKIDNITAEELKATLGDGNVTVTLSLNASVD